MCSRMYVYVGFGIDDLAFLERWSVSYNINRKEVGA